MIDKVVKINFKNSLPCRVCGKPAEFREDYQEGGAHCFCLAHVVKKASVQEFDRSRLPAELR